jgi:hypothetical protein
MKTGISVLTIVALAPLALVFSRASGTERENRSVGDFDSISVGGSIDLQVRQGSPQSVEVESTDGSLSHVVTEVRNGTLRVHHDPTWWAAAGWQRHRHIVRVTLPRLVELEASGGTNVTSPGTITGDRFELQTSGGADVKLEVAVDSLEVRTSGGSDVSLSGRASTASLRSSGGSDLDASHLAAETAHLASSGGSDLSFGESTTLVAHASGGSDISYHGEPRSLSVSTSGGGGVARRHSPR